jgi:hypothetical protein
MYIIQYKLFKYSVLAMENKQLDTLEDSDALNSCKTTSEFVSSKESVSDLSLRAMEDYIIEKQGYDKYVTPGRGDLNETRRKLRDCW